MWRLLLGRDPDQDEDQLGKKEGILTHHIDISRRCAFVGGEKREENREVRDRGNEMRKKGKVSKQNSCNFFKERRIQTRETGVDAFSKAEAKSL